MATRFFSDFILYFPIVLFYMDDIMLNRAGCFKPLQVPPCTVRLNPGYPTPHLLPPNLYTTQSTQCATLGLVCFYNRWTIKARITNKSDIRSWSNARGTGTLFSIDLLDAQGGEIRATFFKESCEKWNPILVQDKVLLLTPFPHVSFLPPISLVFIIIMKIGFNTTAHTVLTLTGVRIFWWNSKSGC